MLNLWGMNAPWLACDDVHRTLCGAGDDHGLNHYCRETAYLFLHVQAHSMGAQAGPEIMEAPLLCFYGRATTDTALGKLVLMPARHSTAKFTLIPPRRKVEEAREHVISPCVHTKKNEIIRECYGLL